MLTRAGIYLSWLVGFLVIMALIGMLPTIFVFVIAYMRVEGNERWSLVLPCAVGRTFFSWGLFDQLLALPWPQTEIGDLIPWVKQNIPST